MKNSKNRALFTRYYSKLWSRYNTTLVWTSTIDSRERESNRISAKVQEKSKLLGLIHLRFILTTLRLEAVIAFRRSSMSNVLQQKPVNVALPPKGPKYAYAITVVLCIPNYCGVY